MWPLNVTSSRGHVFRNLHYLQLLQNKYVNAGSYLTEKKDYKRLDIYTYRPVIRILLLTLHLPLSVKGDIVFLLCEMVLI